LPAKAVKAQVRKAKPAAGAEVAAAVADVAVAAKKAAPLLLAKPRRFKPSRPFPSPGRQLPQLQSSSLSPNR
jgi:hypothetical protein